MNENLKGRLVYLIAVNTLLLIAVAVFRLVFLSPLPPQISNLNASLTRLAEKQKEAQRAANDYRAEKERYKNEIQAITKGFDDNFCRAGVEEIQSAISEAISKTKQGADFDFEYSMKEASFYEALDARMSFKNITPADFFKFAEAVKKNVPAVSSAIEVQSPGTGETAIEYKFYVPFNKLDLKRLLKK